MAEEALPYLYAAKSRYDDVVGGRLEEPARLSPALLERLAEPLFGLYRDMADRLAGCGDAELGLVRRELIELLRGLTGRLGDPVRVQLASALSDLAGDLVAEDRVDEADAAAAEADATMPSGSDAAVEDLARGVVGRGADVVTWTPLPSTASYAATTASLAAAIAGLSGLDAEQQPEAGTWLQIARPEARRLEQQRMDLARVDADRREAERPQPSAPQPRSLRPNAPGQRRPNVSRPSDGPQPRRRIGWSGSVAARTHRGPPAGGRNAKRNGARRSGSRLSDGRRTAGD